MLKTGSTPFLERQSRWTKLRLHPIVARQLLIAFIGLVIVGCFSSIDDSLIDRSFLTQQPCAPPCWYGLQIEESTESDVVATLKTLPFIDQETISRYGPTEQDDENDLRISYDCRYAREKALEKRCGGARLSQDRLKSIWMAVNYELTFETVVDLLGPPTYIDYGPYHVEVPGGGCIVDLAWPDRGIVVGYLDTTGNSLCQAIRNGTLIDSNAQVQTIYYIAREAFGPKPAPCCKRVSWPGLEKP